jgi:hypothetical protein
VVSLHPLCGDSSALPVSTTGGFASPAMRGFIGAVREYDGWLRFTRYAGIHRTLSVSATGGFSHLNLLS